MLHRGHMRLLERAKDFGDYLIVGVTDEDYDRSRGKLNVAQSTAQRVEAIKAIEFVNEVIIESHRNQKSEDMVKYKVDTFAIGDDWLTLRWCIYLELKVYLVHNLEAIFLAL